MASIIYNNFWNALCKGNVDLDSDTFKVMLVTSSYTENKDTHTNRNNVTNEVSGTGYTAGGNTVTVTVQNVDTANDRQEITLGGTTWPNSTITARKAIYYKDTGNAATDILVACIDFGTDISTSAGTFTLNASTIRIQN